MSVPDPKEEKVKCLKEIDHCTEWIKQNEQKLENSKKYVTQGSIGVFIGLFSFILGLFYPLCFIGLVFGLAGGILLFINILGWREAAGELKSTREILAKWKEKLYRLES
jgi:hypothetical protein